MKSQIVNSQDNTTHVRIDGDLHKRAKALAQRSPHVTLTFIVDQALRDFLDFYGDDGVVVIELRK